MNKIKNQVKEINEFVHYYFQLFHDIIMNLFDIVQLINQQLINDFYIEHIVMVTRMINMKVHNELENFIQFIQS